MVKVKYNEAKDTYTIKDLDYVHLSVLAGLLSHTILGVDSMPNAAFEITEAIDAQEIDPCNVKVELDSEGYFGFVVN